MTEDRAAAALIEALMSKLLALPPATRSELLAFLHAAEDASGVTSILAADETRFEIRMTAILPKPH